MLNKPTAVIMVVFILKARLSWGWQDRLQQLSPVLTGPTPKEITQLHTLVVKSCLFPWAHFICLLPQEAFPLSPVSCISLNAPSLFAGKGAPAPSCADSHEDSTGIVSISQTLGRVELQCLRFTDFLDVAVEDWCFLSGRKNCEVYIIAK